MATITQSLELQDRVTNRFNQMSQAADGLINRFSVLDNATDNLNLSSAFEQAAGDIHRIAGTLDDINERLNETQEQASKAKSAFGGMGTAINAALSYLSIQKVKSFVDEVFGLNNTQIQVEVQLATVLNNQGQTMGAFDELRKRAADIQGYSMYGDEAMIAGAAELSTYISDSAAISSMMGTLANYAAGMSGGGAVDTSAMTEYATQLGKALDGTYDGLKKKGFELSDAQKEIIENGTDMEKALVLDEVINQSWADLAANMRKTPIGMITSINNTLGDMGEVIGARLTPKFMELAEAAYQFLTSSGVQDMIDTIIVLLTWVFDILEWGIGILQAAADHWDTVKVVLLGAAAAFLVYQITTNGAAIALGIAKNAQQLFNAALGASPLVWAVVGVTALCAALALYTEYVNSAYGLSLSFSGMLGGSLMVILAALGNVVIMIYNIVVEIVLSVWNYIANFVNFFANVWSDPLGSVVRLFTGVFDNILSIIETVAGAIGSLFGQDWSSGIQKFRDDMNKAVTDQFGTGAVDVTVDEKMLSLDYIDYGEAFDAGYYLGENLFGGADANSPYEFDYESLFNNGPDGSADDPIHTEVDNDINIADEDLKLLRDIAEARYVQNFVTLTPTVQVSGNTINEKADINAIVDEIEYRLESEFAASAEGVYG